MSGVRKRSITIRGHRTSFSVEDRFFEDLCTIAKARGVSLGALVATIDESRPKSSNLSSALRIFVLDEAQRDRRDLASGDRV